MGVSFLGRLRCDDKGGRAWQPDCRHMYQTSDTIVDMPDTAPAQIPES